MADEETTSVETTPAPDGGTPDGATAGQTAAELKAENERMAKALKDANREAASRRKRLEELEAAEEQRKAAAMSETEKLQKQLDDLKNENAALMQKHQDRAIKQAIQIEAARMGFIDPYDAMTPAVLAAVSINDDGDVEGVGDALKELAKTKPYLLGQPGRPAAPSAGAGTGNQPERGGAALTASELAAVQAAQAMGYNIDPQKVAQRKADAKTVTWASRENEE